MGWQAWITTLLIFGAAVYLAIIWWPRRNRQTGQTQEGEAPARAPDCGCCSDCPINQRPPSRG